MKKIAVVGLAKKIGILEFVEGLKTYEKKYNFTIDKFIYSNEEFNLYDVLTLSNLDINDYFAVISVGGDGTFLYTSRVFAGTEIPVFGVNIGQVGFNAHIELKEFDYYFEKFLNNQIEFEYKSMLDVQIEGEEKIYNVLNDGVISHSGISRVIRLKVDLEGHCIYDFRGDGLIISSPTGSTAYNLSAGGPILHPDVDAFSLCPICPHTLAIRPFIIPFNEKLIISVLESSTQQQITLDGQKTILLKIGQVIIFKKSSKKVKVIKTEKNFYEILKLKLGWLG